MTVQTPLTQEERLRRQWEQMRERAIAQGPGTVGLLSGELMRYSQFHRSFMVLELPPGTRPFHDPGINIVDQCNGMVRAARQANSEWLWIIADDHIFEPDIVLRLLDRNVDVVVPFCLQRTAPFYPVIYEGQDENGHYKIVSELPLRGVSEVYAAGTAGMLIRKSVIDALPEKPFTLTPDHHNEDLEFCGRVREAGFKIHVDVDVRLGHIGVMWNIPIVVEGEKVPGKKGWGIGLTIGNETTMKLYRPIEGAPAVLSAL